MTCQACRRIFANLMSLWGHAHLYHGWRPVRQ